MTLHIGEFLAQEKVLYCPDCRRTFHCKELDSFVAPGSNFGYDIIEFVGTAVWCRYKTIKEVQEDLKCKNIPISEREISYLSKKFVLYVIEAHNDSQKAMRGFLHGGGGYFLHFDAAHPGQGSSHLMCAVAEESSEKSQIVLGSAKLSTESTETVADFLRGLKGRYGDPLAGICDLLASNLAAFREVFPGVLLLVCHFHFLRDLGKDFMSFENTRLEGILAAYDTNKRLKDFAKDCKEHIERDPSLAPYLQLKEEHYISSFTKLPDVVLAYFMTTWILNYRQELYGYGFPFDKATFSYLQRMKKMEECLSGSAEKGAKLTELHFMLRTLLEDEHFAKQMNSMEKKVKDFEHIRFIMQIAPTFKGKGLNEDGEECDMTLMQQELQKFMNSGEIKNNSDSGYKKMVKQMGKYWNMLFANPVPIIMPTGDKVFVYPQRTNNLMERFFREFIRCECKRTGTDTFSRRTQTMIAETPMVKNLQNPDCLKILLNGETSLAARFAQLDANRVGQEMRDEHAKGKLPIHLQKFIENSSFCKLCKTLFSTFKKAA